MPAHPRLAPVTETTYTLILTEYQAQCLAKGYVPNGVKAALAVQLDCVGEDARRAARPVQS